jgi:hypothetical protein
MPLWRRNSKLAKATFIIAAVGLAFAFAALDALAEVDLAQLVQNAIYLPAIIKSELPTPTPAPTQQPPGSVYVLPNHSNYVTSWGSLHIVGEVLNNTSDPISWIKISANLFDSTGHLLDTDFTFPYLDNLAAGEKTCFDLIFSEPPADWSYYEFEPPTYSVDGEPLLNMNVFDDSGRYDPTDGSYEIIGQVRNDNSFRVEYVAPIGTLYNASGTVVGCDLTWVNSTNLDPGQTSFFKITFYGRDYLDVVSYRIQVNGNPQ